jgi:hypothetical protein
VGLTSGETWNWTGGNAIENVAYSEDVEVPEFTWRWFSTGTEIHNRVWIRGEPKQDFNQQYGSYVGCAAMNSDVEMKTFNCRTPLRFIIILEFKTIIKY